MAQVAGSMLKSDAALAPVSANVSSSPVASAPVMAQALVPLGAAPSVMAGVPSSMAVVEPSALPSIR